MAEPARPSLPSSMDRVSGGSTPLRMTARAQFKQRSWPKRTDQPPALPACGSYPPWPMTSRHATLGRAAGPTRMETPQCRTTPARIVRNGCADRPIGPEVLACASPWRRAHVNGSVSTWTRSYRGTGEPGRPPPRSTFVSTRIYWRKRRAARCCWPRSWISCVH
jgi:hypothetical protein